MASSMYEIAPPPYRTETVVTVAPLPAALRNAKTSAAATMVAKGRIHRDTV
jgi:hypothetical protein